MDVVVRQRMHVLLPVDIFSQLLSVKSSQSCIGSYPYKSFWLSIDTTYSRGKSLLQGNLFIVVMAGFQREALLIADGVAIDFEMDRVI